MDLTEQERIRLWSHCRILGSAEGDSAWRVFAEVLRQGLKCEYYRLTEGFSGELSEEVRDVLHMYQSLQRSNRELEPA